jgi:hypothetical protein
MPQQVVFPCPSCGGSLSADEGATRVQCHFCGNTAPVPEALRGPAAPPRVPDYTNKAGQPAVWNQAEWEAIGDALRAGDKAQAVKLYQQMFQVSEPDARQDVDALAAGKMVTLGTRALGRPFAAYVPKTKGGRDRLGT